MKKLLPVLLVLLLTSCASVPSYMKDFGQDTSELPILVEGKITYNTPAEGNSISIFGGAYDTPATFWYATFKRYSAVHRTWKGEISFKEERQELAVQGLADHSFDYIDPNNFSGTKMNMGNLEQLQDIEIIYLPEEYSFPSFHIYPIGGDFKFRFTDDEMPIVLTNFSIGNKDFSVLLTSMKFYEGYETSSSTYLELVEEDVQLYQIIDTSGKVYAEFKPGYYVDDNSGWDFFKDQVYKEGIYKIFEVDPTFDESKLVPAIAVFNVIKYMIQYSELSVTLGGKVGS